MPSLPTASWLGQAIFLSATITGRPSSLGAGQRLLDDPQATATSLVQADPEPAVGVGGVPVTTSKS